MFRHRTCHLSHITDVGVWLKSLRLHKYSPLLCSLTYDELLALDEGTLESQGVTKGARHKIVLSINKLKERHKQLVQIEKVNDQTLMFVKEICTQTFHYEEN